MFFDEKKLSDKNDDQIEEMIEKLMERYNKLSNLNYKHPALDFVIQEVVFLRDELELRRELREIKTGTVFESDKKSDDTI